MPQWFCPLPTENITAKHIVSNDSSDSDDEAQGPKGKKGRASCELWAEKGKDLSNPSVNANDTWHPEVLGRRRPLRDRTIA